MKGLLLRGGIMQVNFAGTFFAPADRASVKEIANDIQLFSQATALRSTLDAVPDIILILNTYRQVVFINEAGAQAMGLVSWIKATGQRPGELMGCIHSSETPGGCGTTEFCRTCGAVKAILTALRGEEDIQECRISLNNGGALDLRVWAKPLHLGNGKYMIFTIKDIGDEKRRQALEHIFFHDILNVAGIVSGYAKMLETDTSDSHDMIHNLSQASQRLVEEIMTQRALLAAEKGSLVIQTKTIDIAQLLQRITKQYEWYTNCAVRIVDPGVSVDFISDPILLGRVIGNMLKNAIEASSPGDIVTLSYTVTESKITFAVHNPTSMPHKVQLQVFNRSFSTKGDGRGLGTYSIKILSEQYLQGRVWFESTREKGTTFYAAYPLEPTTKQH